MAAALDPEHSPFVAIVAECPFADLLEAAGERARKLFPLPVAVSGILANFAVAGGNLYTSTVEGLDFHQSSPVHSIGKLRTPILLIHGLNDTRTPPSHSAELAQANPDFTELWFVPGAHHVGSYTEQPRAYREHVLKLFAAASSGRDTH
jgi:dipeptidyl aminopeptidase/acylaminoacyl peptidase